jgi:tetratricopeptide (TPR) repeat protein
MPSRDLGAFRTAKSYFESIMDVYREMHIGPTIELADSLFAYAVTLRAADDHDESVTILEQATSIYRRLYGEQSLATVVSMFVLASAHFEADSIEDATTLLDDCLDMFRKFYGSTALETNGKAIVEPPVIGDILNYLGSAKQVS